MEKKRALFICSNLFPVNSGGTIYAYGNILRFSQYFDIDLVSYVQCDNPETEPYFNELREKIHAFHAMKFDTGYPELIRHFFHHKVVFQKYSKKLTSLLTDIMVNYEYDYIFLDGFLIFYLIDSIRKFQEKASLILIEENIEFTNFDEQIRFSTGIFQKIINFVFSIGVKQFELLSLGKADFTLFISPEDKGLAESLLGKHLPFEVLPPFFPYDRVKSTRDLENITHNLLILGSMWWYPNVQGTQWFVEEVFYQLHERDPRYRLYIVGNKPAPEILNYNSESVIVTGKVPSVDEYIRMCDFLIVPNYSGGGVKLKILEGIMKGIPVLARPESLTGYPETIFPSEYVTRDPETFARIIIEQNEDFRKKREFLDHARENLMQNCDIDKIIERIMHAS